MSVITRETRPSRFPEDTVPSVAGRSKPSESLAAISIERRTTGLTGSQLRLWGKLIDKVVDRVGRGAAILELFLVGVVMVLIGGGLAGGAPGGNEEILWLGVPGSIESLFTPGDVSGVVWDLLFPNSRIRSLLDPLVLDVLCDDEESARRKSGDRVEAEGLGAVEGRAGLPSPRVVN